MRFDKDPYPIIIRAGLLDGHLPVVTIKLKVIAIDNEDEGGSGNIGMI